MTNEITCNWQHVQESFYIENKVLTVATQLLGKILATSFNGQLTAGRIVETEAYQGVTDRASHAWGGRLTNRTRVMYGQGGVAYVYLCYGIHHLFNIVTGGQDTPHVVLIRALEPVCGIDIMQERMGKKQVDLTLTKGPGNLSRALGINTTHTGLSLVESDIFVADDGYMPAKKVIAATPRIGVDYAGPDAALPYRFIIKDNPYVSGKKLK